MCGLFGVISSTLVTSEIDNAEFLGYLSGTRGMHSTGVAVVGRSNKGKTLYDVCKKPYPSPNFLRTADYDAMMRRIDTHMIYTGHARHATIGKINEENAHPIEDGDLIVCHNGTIHSMAPKKEDEDTETDSKELVRRIKNIGLFKALSQAEYGAWALSIINLEKRSISFVRNNDRELWFMQTPGGGTLYWASEKWMLNALKEKSSTTFETPFLMPTYKIHRYQFGSMKRTEVDVPETKRDSSASPFAWDRTITELTATDISKKIGAATAGSSVPLLPGPSSKIYYTAYKGNTISIMSARQLLNKGCSCCKKSKYVHDAVKWWRHDEFLCDQCHDHDELAKNFIVNKYPTYDGKIITQYMQ